MRARQPDRSDAVVRDGVRVVYDVYGEANTPTVVLLPTWVIAQAAHWKAQIPVLARRYRVITVEPRGNGRSDRPTDPSAYLFAEQAADIVAIMDATNTPQAVVAGVSCGAVVATTLASIAPERLTGIVMIGPSLWSLAPPLPPRAVHSFSDELDTNEGWALYNMHAWRRDLEKFAQFFWREIFTEPHSTKQIEDGVGWTVETDAETVIATELACDTSLGDRETTIKMLAAIECPVLVIHGTRDRISSQERSEVAATATGADVLILEGSGHCPQARDPVRVNRALVDFVERVTPAADRSALRTTWTRAMDRPKRVLYLSSPIGLGHARRDLAIARSLRAHHPDTQIDWLAQEPVTTFLGATGETIHPASGYLAGESAHIASEAHEHSLHAFQAVRRMDEILVANFSVFQDLVDSGDYDLVVADEAWDVDLFWHENPELKRTALAWMTDFVGWLPMPDGGSAEAALTADYNAEMIDHVTRFRRIRDRSIFVGDPEDIVAGTFGPDLPAIRDWTAEHFAFSGYITGFDPDELADRERLRDELGYRPDETVVVVTVGGSGVGSALLRKVIAAVPLIREQVPELRMIAVAGPRIDPASLPRYDGVEVRGYVEGLHRHLAACDAAIVQGGLTTTMELVANQRPFLYFPLGQHFEQSLHVRHRLNRHRAGTCMDYTTCDAEVIATKLVKQLGTTCDYLPVPADGASRAATLIAELL
jgi:pimeloyl-ACP methyl ester carboxylesterase/predicted glycosyltransferase